MRLLLDEHVSGRVIGKALASDGHDVRAVDSEDDLKGLPDEAIFGLAVSEERVLITANVRDFMPLVVEWAGGGKSHAGLVLIPSSIRNEEFGRLLAGLRTALESDHREWTDRVEWLSRRDEP